MRTTTDTGVGAGGWSRRLAWFVGLWAVSAAAVGAVGMGLHAILHG